MRDTAHLHDADHALNQCNQPHPIAATQCNATSASSLATSALDTITRTTGDARTIFTSSSCHGVPNAFTYIENPPRGH
jgi:hypothetical protein